MRHIKVRVLRNPHRKSRKRAKRAKHRRWGRVKSHARRVNPRRKRSHSRSRARRNPSRSRRRRNPALSLKSALSVSNILRYVAMGGGFIVGVQVQGFLTSGQFFGMGPVTAPAWTATIKPARPVFGLAQILLGGLIASKSKKAIVRDAAIGIAVAGGFDIATQVLALVKPKAAAATAGVHMLDNRMGVSMPQKPYAVHGYSSFNDPESSMG